MQCECAADTGLPSVKELVAVSPAEAAKQQKAKLRSNGLAALSRFFAALSEPRMLPPLLAIVGAKKDMDAGESYWLVKPIARPYVLEKIAFGLEAGFWVIEVQHFKLTGIDRGSNKRTYMATKETNTYPLFPVVRHLQIKWQGRGLVLSGHMHKSIVVQGAMEDRTAHFFKK